MEYLGHALCVCLTFIEEQDISFERESHLRDWLFNSLLSQWGFRIAREVQTHITKEQLGSNGKVAAVGGGERIDLLVYFDDYNIPIELKHSDQPISDKDFIQVNSYMKCLASNQCIIIKGRSSNHFNMAHIVDNQIQMLYQGKGTPFGCEPFVRRWLVDRLKHQIADEHWNCELDVVSLFKELPILHTRRTKEILQLCQEIDMNMHCSLRSFISCLTSMLNNNNNNNKNIIRYRRKTKRLFVASRLDVARAFMMERGFIPELAFVF